MTSLLRLPFKVAGRAAGTSLRLAGAAAESVVDRIAGRRRAGTAVPPRHDESPPPPFQPPARPASPEPAAASPAPPATPPVPENGRAGAARPPTKGGHQSRTRAAAAELRTEQREAEQTEDSPGAEIRIDEPWEGYRKLRAPEIVDRLAVADEAEKAVVLLYEQAHRKRKTVLDAAAKP